MSAPQDPSQAGVISSRRSGPVWLVELSGDVDMDCIQAVERVTAALAARSADPIVFDVGGLGFADSTLLNHLLRTRQHRPVGLVGANPFLRRVLDVTGTSGALPSFDDVDEAAAALGMPTCPPGGC
ncbi:STAS domain-containing protein [Streptomyces sp. NPDC046985]|uniref:STAS domain-containing protein n=1 Tax=Streptomyces sp. NPDC046985 TaxID=3155377 RepID=UPI0033E2432A